MTKSSDSGSSLDESAVRDALRTVVDPEVGVNIVDLGLIYRIELAPSTLLIEMTMTSVACPMGEVILEEVETVLAQRFPDTKATVEIVWDPPWDPAMMSERARRALE